MTLLTWLTSLEVCHALAGDNTPGTACREAKYQLSLFISPGGISWNPGLFILMIHDIYGDCARRSSGERTPPASVAFDSSDSPSVLAGPAAGDYPVINLERRGSVSGTRA